MKILNRIIFIFLFLTTVVLYGAWRFVHSEKFSKIASSHISKILHRKASVDLSFSKVEVGVFPPKTIFHKVKLLKNDQRNVDLNITADDLEIIFSYSDIFVSDFEVDRILIRRGKVNVKTYSSDTEKINWGKVSTGKVYKEYLEILKAMPFKLKSIELIETQTEVDEVSSYAKSLSVLLQMKSLKGKGIIENIQINLKDKYNFKKVKVDSFEFLVHFEKTKWLIESAVANVKDVGSLNLSAILENKDGREGLFTQANGKAKLKLNELTKMIESVFPGSSTDLKRFEGELGVNFDIVDQLLSPDIKMDGQLINITTPWIKAENVQFSGKKEKNKIFLDKLMVTNGLEKYTLTRSDIFYDLEKMHFNNFHFKMLLENAHTNTFLYAIDDVLKTFKASVTGEVDIKLLDDKAIFEFNERLHFLNFGLMEKNESKFILKNPGFSLSRGRVVILKDMTVLLDFLLAMPGTELKTNGAIYQDKIEIGFKESKLDLTSLGPIAGVSLRGGGKTEGMISGSFEDVIFKFNVDWGDVSVIDLNLGNVKSKFDFSLKDLKIKFDQLRGNYNKTDYTCVGEIGFQGQGILNLDIDFEGGTYSDLEHILHLALKNIKSPLPMDMDIKSKARISGGFDLEALKVEGEVYGENLKIGSEEAESLSLKLSLLKNQLNLRDIKISKSRGRIDARFHTNLENKFIDFNGVTKNLRLSDFNYYRDTNLKYDGELFVEFDGSGTSQDFNSRFKSKITDAFIDNVPASSSEVSLYTNAKETVLSLNLLEGKIKSDSLISFKNNLAAIKSSIDTNDLREMFGVFSGHNVNDKKLVGAIKLKSQMHLVLEPFSIKRFMLNFDQFFLKREGVKVQLDSKRNKVEIQDGLVKFWNLKFSDGNEFFNSVGKNRDDSTIVVDNKFSMKANILEIISEDIYRASGIVKGNNRILIGDKVTIDYFNLYGHDHLIKLRKVPGPISALDFMIVKNGDVFEVSNMAGKYGGGDFKIGGTVKPQGIFPQINLNYQIEKATIPILKKSNVIVSALGTLRGGSLPYRLDGKINFLHGELLDDPSDLTKDDKVNVDGYKKYLPERIYSKNKELFDLNVSFNTTSPVVIRNNLAEVYVKGSGTLRGDLIDPELILRLEVVPSISKFKFKGHDFVLGQGSFDIRDQGKNRVSDLKITGLSKISDYDVKLDITGNIAKVNVDLSSEPALSKDDLLSLLTLGVTQDISKGLGSSERESVTTVGLGTLLVDQLKINEDLNTALGLKLSVMPEFKHDETSLTQGKSAISESNSGKLKSATKIKVKKEISKKVDFSLSSTVGGSIEPKQEMNLNYKFNKNFSLEGIYEVKPAEDNNTDNPNSMGLDFKWRKSF